MANIYQEKTGRYRDDDGTEYILALTNLGALANGDCVILDAANTTATQQAVKASTTTSGESVVGVATETIASGSVGKIQTYGYHSAVKIDGTTTSVAIGDNLQSGVIAKKVDKFEAVTVDPSNGGGLMGVCLETVAQGSDETFAVFIDTR